MPKNSFPVTPAIRLLKNNKVHFSLHPYKYEEKGGTKLAADELNVDEHQVIKTLVMENERREPVVVLMHGDKQVSTKAFARVLKVKTIRPCEPEVAHRHTGYFVGGISPLGSKKQLKMYYETSIVDLSYIYINAGKKGVLARVSPKDLIKMIEAIPVNIAI